MANALAYFNLLADLLDGKARLQDPSWHHVYQEFVRNHIPERLTAHIGGSQRWRCPATDIVSIADRSCYNRAVAPTLCNSMVGSRWIARITVILEVNLCRVIVRVVRPFLNLSQLRILNNCNKTHWQF